jgi:23S rRNA (uracil1939-C5)-methyltransferase
MEHVERLRIERLSNSPDGIAHLPSGMTVFIPQTCPGDLVEARIVEEHHRFARAELVEVLEPSDLRVRARCPLAGCGGCPWQHVSYEAQLSAKRDQVIDALARIGHFDRSMLDGLVDETVASPLQWGYRNKVEFSFVPGTRPCLGLHATRGDVMPVERCLLLPKRHAKLPGAITGALRYLQGNAGRELAVERVGVRVSTRTNELELAFWSAPGALDRTSLASVMRHVHDPSSIVNVLTGRKRRRNVSGVTVICGKGCWHERLDDDLLAFSAPSFFQVNTPAAELLRELALSPIAETHPTRAFDLYCGAGTFTVPLARLADQVLAIESSSSAVRDLKRNLRHCHVSAQVVGGAVERELATIGSADACIVDPPRAGLLAGAADALCDAGLPRLVYVSCNAATLARDLELLCRQTYRIERVTPVDLFPQTPHVEAVVVMSRINR